MRLTTARIAPLVFGSGGCALVAQVCWQRELRLIFGGSTAASAAVLAIFIGGLGVGGIVLGPLADRHPRPLRLYAIFEGVIGGSAALTPFLLDLVRLVYVALGGGQQLGPAGGSAIRLLLTALVLALPCVAMGGTLPAVARAIETDQDARRRGVALIYGINSLGAVAGVVLATFVLIEQLGTRATLWAGCTVNALIALAAWRLAAGERAATAVEPEGVPDHVAFVATPAARAFALFAAGAVGFVFFLMEIVWYRMLTPLLGGTVFTFGLVLAVALLGIGAGGALYGAFGERRPVTLTGFSATCLVEAAALAFPYVLGDRIALLALRLRGWEVGFGGHVIGWSAVTGLTVFPAAVASGFQFPLLIALLGRGRQEVGRHVGLAYAWNTAGAMAGSLAGGFGLLPLLSATGCWQLASALLASLGVIARSHEARRRSPLSWLAPPLAAGAILGGLFGFPGPSAAWRHSGIGAGRASSAIVRTPNTVREWLNRERAAIVWEADGVESSVALRCISGLAFSINGKVDGNCRGDASVMVMSGLLGAALHPSPARALIVGLGTGNTVGWLADLPACRRVEVVELEPRVLDVARDCGIVNRNALSNPKVKVSIGDAREVLPTRRERYDLIVSEPSNPYRAGIAGLFTRDFYRAVDGRLLPGGLFVQWIQAYEVDGETVDTVYATLSSVFPIVETWQVNRSDLLLVAAREPIELRAEDLRRRLAEEPYRTALRVAWRTEGLEGFLGRYLGGALFTRARAGSARLNTDDRNRVEFGFARTVGRVDLSQATQLAAHARRLGDHRPKIVGPVDWVRVEDERTLLHTIEGKRPAPSTDFDPGQRARAEAQLRFLRGDARGTWQAWRRQDREPESPAELAILGTALAMDGREEALVYAGRLRPYQPIEADVIQAMLRYGQQRPEPAVSALESAFVRSRSDPWPASSLLREAMSLAVLIAQTNPALADRVFEALRQPFAVRHVEHDRVHALLLVSMRLPAEPYCRVALEWFEPYPPWRSEELLFRRNCYATTGDQRYGRAESDLAEYLRLEAGTRTHDLPHAASSATPRLGTMDSVR